MPSNPLIGENQMTVNDRSADMTNLYDHKIIREILIVANRYQIGVKTGILAAISGPCFETPAEYRFIRTIGADAVGMSIIPEIITARQLNMNCLAISVITDLGIGGKLKEVTHHEVLKAASRAEPKMTLLIKKLLEGF
jgi:purine-nucleoside phosphorylase